MMIGKYSPGAPALRPWDPRAANVAQMVHTLVAAQLPGVVVEHVGSTAVPGCDGKGVVDLMVLYPPGTLEATRAVLDGLGFERQHARLSFPETRPLRQGTLTYDDTPFSLHAHVLAADDDEVTEMRVWREALRTSTDMRGCYIATKHTVLDASPADGTAYALAKGVFVQNAVWALRAGVPAAALAVYPALPPLPVPAPTRTHSALVLIDTQVNMFDPASPVHDAEGLR